MFFQNTTFTRTIILLSIISTINVLSAKLSIPDDLKEIIKKKPFNLSNF